MRRRVIVSTLASVLVGIFGGTAAGSHSPSDHPLSQVAQCATVSAAPFGNTPCPGIRPGAQLYTGLVNGATGDEAGGLCTMNFLFRGSDGRRYIGTAGHCTSVGYFPGEEKSWTAGDGPPAWDADGREFGEFAYGIMNMYEEDPNLPQDADFGLIRIKPGIRTDPQMCHFGGPMGINRALIASPTVVMLHHYGAGIASGRVSEADTWLVPARTAVAAGMPNPRKVFFDGYAMPGDSGSPIISDNGRAVGIFTDVPYPLGYPVPDDAWTNDRHPGVLLGPRLGPALRRAERVLGIELELLRAPVL